MIIRFPPIEEESFLDFAYIPINITCLTDGQAIYHGFKLLVIKNSGEVLFYSPVCITSSETTSGTISTTSQITSTTFTTGSFDTIAVFIILILFSSSFKLHWEKRRRK